MNKHQDNPIQELKGRRTLPWSRPFLFRLRKLGPWWLRATGMLQASLQACVRLGPSWEALVAMCAPPQPCQPQSSPLRLPETPSSSHSHSTSHPPFPAMLLLRAGSMCSLSFTRTSCSSHGGLSLSSQWHLCDC